jgi:hypothetical protein
MSLALLFHYLLLDMFRMLVHPSSGACDLFVELFHELYCSGLCWCHGVVRLGWRGILIPAAALWCGILMQAEAHCTPHRNTNTHRTRAIQPMK